MHFLMRIFLDPSEKVDEILTRFDGSILILPTKSENFSDIPEFSCIYVCLCI